MTSRGDSGRIQFHLQTAIKCGSVFFVQKLKMKKIPEGCGYQAAGSAAPERRPGQWKASPTRVAGHPLGNQINCYLN